MKIIITGGTGFLGRHVVWRLAAAGHQIIFTGRNRAQAEQVITMLNGNGAAQFVQLEHGSAYASLQLQRCAAQADAIIHCAALASPWGSRTAFMRANVASTEEVLAACATHHITRLVHISSPSIYFEFRDRLGITEDDPLPAAVNEYAYSKKIAEELVLQAKLPDSIILRPRAIFGPWDNALLPRLLRLMRYGRIPLLRGGKAQLDMTYVENVVDAIVLSLTLPTIAMPRIFNITNGEPIQAAALFASLTNHFQLPLRLAHKPYAAIDLAARGLELIARILPGWEPPFTRYSLGALAFSQTLSLHRATTILGYQPRISLEDGIVKTAQWWATRKHVA